MRQPISFLNPVKNTLHARAVAFDFSLWGDVQCPKKTKKSPNICSDLLVAGEPQISNFLEGYEMVVELWLYMNRQDS